MVWRKFSPRAQAAFSLLMETPGVAMSADEIATKIGLANGKHGLAGVLTWPSRQCAELGLVPPFRYDNPTAPGETGSYWMDPEPRNCSAASRKLPGHQEASGTIVSKPANAAATKFAVTITYHT